MKRYLLVLIIAGALLVAACGSEPTATPDAFESPIDTANPASVHCVEQGYELEIRTEEGGSVGYCIFDDGSECEEWAYYRGECEPGTNQP
ncbi:MAG: DUF333 domain-containing protein [Anaerolineae bacterium]|jgi:putative hemolysin